MHGSAGLPTFRASEAEAKRKRGGSVGKRKEARFRKKKVLEAQRKRRFLYRKRHDDGSEAAIGLEERLTGILVDEGDRDLLMQQSNREDRVLQWLQALDMKVIGACRSDERLKPLLKMNASNDAAEGRLLAQLTQHFEPTDVGMLARCFCIPLVSVRVGKINKQGIILCRTN